ncbi:F0F1 ATP synthase subunit gamma [Pelagimonas varians]|uniref:ATP synthase gamma chain n=1 Tax=Pelagimonas varians TaxID=696760 RepID=A0A238L620_9RHOB|nr:FoF1 ATP synthase subunit gamma [Pelagimonas varians]PYG26348.1 F-type H+-transporting ATPase subunit gamma [Pelagimonas varians]SMX49766.1 ATP synthase gamma chain [Pelagimonas varians]
MAQSLEALARRTTSMQGIRSVVHTMKTLSVINAAPYEHAARAIEAYHETVLNGMHAFLSQSAKVNTGLVQEAAQVVVVFGSDHGLCGNYNEVIAAHVAPFIQSDLAGQGTLLCIGAQMVDALTDKGLTIDACFLPPASVDGIGRLANLLTQRLDQIRAENTKHEIAVTLAYSARVSGGGWAPKIAPLLPLNPALVAELQAKPWASRSVPSFSMPPGELFMALIRKHLFASLFRAAAEALVTENAARLALMQQAEQSVDDRLDALKSEMRNLRQSEITTELLDVIIGFEALKKPRRPAPNPSE